ncbi:hypothetical protein KFL_001420200 [Klebsormidium nitens]|uniref:Pentatricopeptide repeat domain containing protein n=1 Tax=Klebsormidium nitens TaxID=105231 RepID=A0A1Y1HXC3_KLENI|nr:hypothetical protein KFL_001420200 [Klebsormidium nitens]|eukprot:GAQ83295.1 hypothetical protein KFL_001420200 [Klebsormidium nitens]
MHTTLLEESSYPSWFDWKVPYRTFGCPIRAYSSLAQANARSGDAQRTENRKPSLYEERTRQKWGSPMEQRRGLLLGTLLKSLPVDADLRAELLKEGQTRDDFSPVEIRLALRTLCLDDLGRKTVPDWERALQLATWYLEPLWKVSPFDHTVLNELWKILGEARRADRIMALYEEGKRQRGVSFGKQVVERVVKSLFVAGYYQEVVDVMDEAQENGWEVELFDEFIQSQVNLGMVDEALMSFGTATARKHGTPVLTQTYAALLGAGVPSDRLRSGRNDCDLARALGQLGRKREAVQILRDTVYAMRRGQFFPVHLWLDAIVTAIEMGCVEEAEDFRDRGQRNAGFFLAPVLSSYVKHRHVLMSHRALLTVLKLEPGLNVKGIGPALISLLCLAQHADEAVEILDALLKQGCVPFPKTFGKIIFCLLDEGRLPEAEAVLASFYQHVEAQPDPQLSTRVFDAFVRRYLRVKQPERVLELVRQARAHKQLIPLKALYEWVQHLERHSRVNAAALRKYVQEATSRKQ